MAHLRSRGTSVPDKTTSESPFNFASASRLLRQHVHGDGRAYPAVATPGQYQQLSDQLDALDCTADAMDRVADGIDFLVEMLQESVAGRLLDRKTAQGLRGLLLPMCNDLRRQSGALRAAIEDPSTHAA